MKTVTDTNISYVKHVFDDELRGRPVIINGAASLNRNIHLWPAPGDVGILTGEVICIAESDIELNDGFSNGDVFDIIFPDMHKMVPAQLFTLTDNGPTIPMRISQPTTSSLAS